MELEELFELRKVALKKGDFQILCNCAVEMARQFYGSSDPRRHISQEVAFFLGRANDRSKFEKIVFDPYFSLPPSLREIRSFEKEEKMFDMGQRYPFLDDEELDYLEGMYCSPDTYDMISRMLYDGDTMLRRKLARFNEDEFSIQSETFSKELCLEVFDALIQNETIYDIDNAIEERNQTDEDYRAFMAFMELDDDEDDDNEYSPIFVYDRRTNSVRIDQTDLSDTFLIPIYNFYWADINLSDAIELYKTYFGQEVLFNAIEPALRNWGISVSGISDVAFCVPFFMDIENEIIKRYSLKRTDDILSEVRAKIAEKWLIYQNEKSLR